MKVLFRSDYRIHWIDDYGREYEWIRKWSTAYSHVKICTKEGEWKYIPHKFNKMADLVKWAKVGKLKTGEQK